jgi:hypothetical protein
MFDRIVLRRAVTALAAGLVVLGLGGCATSSVEPRTLSLVASDVGVAGLPASLEAGIYEVTVKNDSSRDMDLELIESAGRPESEFVSDLDAMIDEGAPIPDYIVHVVGIGFIEPAGSLTTTLTLSPADYSLVHTGEGTTVLGTVGVAGDPPAADDLPAGAKITARDYGFTIEGIKAGAQTVTFVNEGPLQVHHAVVLGFPAGTEEGAIREAVQTLMTLDESTPPPEGIPLPDETINIGSSVYSAGMGGTFQATFEAGRPYAVLCFISDRSGGAPHAIAHNMIEVFTVET